MAILAHGSWPIGQCLLPLHWPIPAIGHLSFLWRSYGRLHEGKWGHSIWLAQLAIPPILQLGDGIEWELGTGQFRLLPLAIGLLHYLQAPTKFVANSSVEVGGKNLLI